MAGGEVTREAARIVFSRSKGPVAASWPSCDSIRETFCWRSWDRRGPYSTCPSGRRGVSGNWTGWPLAGLTANATAAALDSPAPSRSAMPAEDRAGAGSFAVAVAAMTIASTVRALDAGVMQPVRPSRARPAASAPATTPDKPVVVAGELLAGNPGGAGAERSRFPVIRRMPGWTTARRRRNGMT